MNDEPRPDRMAASRIVAAVLELVGDPHDASFGERLAFVEAGTLLGQVGEALAGGPDELAEISLARLLRRAPRSELRAIVRELADVAEPPWPEIREALLALES